MLPFFENTEEVQDFYTLMGYTLEGDVPEATYICTYSVDYSLIPIISVFNLSTASNPFISNEKVFNYLALILNGYSFEDAVKEVGVVVD